MATRLLTAGKTPSKILSNIIRLVETARLCEGGSLAAPGVRLSELHRDVVTYLVMLNGQQAVMAHEAIWTSAAGQMAVVHTFLSALRVVCDPRAIAPAVDCSTTAAMPSGHAKAGNYKATRAGSIETAGSGRASAVCEGANDILVNSAATLGRLFIFAAGATGSYLSIQNRALVPGAAAEMVEELLRGNCLPMLSRLIASCTSGTPSAFQATADGTSLLFNMVYFMFVVGMKEPVTRGLVLFPQLPALIEQWARAAAVEAPPAPHGSQESRSQPGGSVNPKTRQKCDGTPRSFAQAMRFSLDMMTLPTLLQHLSVGGDPLRSVLSGPCLQYLVALQVVSQLHAADGGTLYGLPPAAVLPPELAEQEGEGRGSGGGSRRQGPAVLNCDVLAKCVDFWSSCVTVQPRVSLGPLRNRCLVNLCMRLSRVALASLEGAEGPARSPPSQQQRPAREQQGRATGHRGEGSGSSGGSGSSSSNGSSDAAGVSFARWGPLRRPLEAGKCVSVALQSMHLAATVLRGLEADPDRTALSGVCRGGGDGIAGSHGGDLLTTTCRTAPSRSGSAKGGSIDSSGGNSSSRNSRSSSGCGGMQGASHSVTEGDGSPGVAAADSPADTSPAAPEPPTDPRLCSRSFGHRWWPLAVEAVRAAQRQPWEMDMETLKRCCGVLCVGAGDDESDEKSNLDLDEMADMMDRQSDGPACSAMGCAASEDTPQRVDPVPLTTIPPGLAAALSAGLLPTLTDLVRSSCGAASGSVDDIDLAATSMDALTASMKLSEVYDVARGGELLLLLSHANPAQAAALLTALAKASLQVVSVAAVSGSLKDGPNACTTSMLVVNFSCTFCCLLSGLFPREEPWWGAWVWPRGDGCDCSGGSPLAAESEAVAPAYRQMLRLASFALHTWLPVLARMHDLGAQEMLFDLSGHLGQCVTLAARACRAAWRRGDARAVGSWRQLLQRSVCAARWVGAEVVAGWEAEGWWSGAVGQQGDVAAEAGVMKQQQGEEGNGEGEGRAGSEEGDEEAWPYPLPLAPCESAALLRTL